MSPTSPKAPPGQRKNHEWKSNLLSLLLLFMVSFELTIAQSEPQCVQYTSLQLDTPTSLSLHCEGVHSPCDYVLTPTNTTLTETENQLTSVLNQAGIGVEGGALSERCLNSFRSLYCHQVYTACQRESSSNETPGPFVPTNQSVCREDCENVIGRDCTDTQWSYLTNIIVQFRRIGNIQLPAVQQIGGCNNSMALDGSCTPLQTSVLPTNSCIPTTPPQTTAPDNTNNSLQATLIAAVCLGVGIPVLSVSVLLFLIMFCVCQVRKSKRRNDRDPYRERNGMGAKNPLEKVTEFQFESPDTGHIGNGEQIKRGTLMMHKSAVHSALLNVNISPRSGTLAKRLGTKEFLQMTPKQRLQTLDFPHSNICLLKDLWETNFGMTYLGEATGLEPNVLSTTVLIKSLKERASSKVRQQFLIEMTWASGFSHPNIISLLAVCREDPRYMIFEYLEYGSLKDFLKSIDSAWFDFDEVLSDAASTCPSTSNPALGYDDLSSISYQLAEGMDYLSKKAFVLKDLAARNCQVGQGLTVKIANFGLSYDSHSKDYCCLSSTKSTPLPLRWLAPETIRHNKFSVYSDIWSYGVLLWEIFTFGARPYDRFSNAQVVQSILGGELLPLPDHCPESVYQLMTKCWSKNPSKRPWFSVLSEELKDVSSNLSIEEKKAIGGPPSTPDLRKQ